METKDVQKKTGSPKIRKHGKTC